MLQCSQSFPLLLPFTSDPVASPMDSSDLMCQLGSVAECQEPRSRCPLLQFLSAWFHVAGALATKQLEKLQKWCLITGHVWAVRGPLSLTCQPLPGKDHLSLICCVPTTWLVSCALSHSYCCRIENNFLERGDRQVPSPEAEVGNGWHAGSRIPTSGGTRI